MLETKLRVHVTPRGSRNQIVGWKDGVLCVKITAPPVEGAANAAVVKFIADSLGVAKSRVRRVSGETSREKSLAIEGLGDEDVRGKLGAD
jgi:uncharacterized protein (TIGR00251 family)